VGDWASTAVDLMVIITLCLVSGGATAALLPVFFLLPISVAFQDRPALTVIIGTVTAAGYLAVWIFYSERDDMQTLLAARLELDEARERNPDPALDMVYAALQETAAGLRSTVTELHPQVLAQLGLTPAVRELLRQFESCTDLAVEAELEDVGKPESQALLYQAARELLTNVGKHAKATTVWVGLMRMGDRIVLTIDDDGAGFDPAIVAQYVADGHIGLGSLLARFDAMGGSMEIKSRIGYDTQVTATSSREPVASSGE
jgi:two-component system, NarL family, sensor kinase